MGNVGATEIVLILLLATLLFGAGRLADLGRGLGEGKRRSKSPAKPSGAAVPVRRLPAVAEPAALPPARPAPEADPLPFDAPGVEKAPSESSG